MAGTDDHKVRLPILGNDNYAEWAHAMKNWLLAKKLWAIVSGTKKKPDDPKAAATDVEDWEASDAHAQSIIGGQLSRAQYQHIMSVSTAKEQWEKLARVHESPDKHRLASLLRQFYGFDAGTQSVDDAAATLTRIQCDIKNLRAEEAPTDYAKAIFLMRSLGEAYKTVNTILSSDDKLTFESCLTRLKEEESNFKDSRKAALGDSRGAALAAYNRNANSGSRSDRGENNTKPAVSHRLGNCSNCGKEGHWAVDCWTDMSKSPRHSYRGRSERGHGGQGRSGRYSSSNRHSQLASLATTDTSTPIEGAWAARAQGSPPDARRWIIDTGATNHMTPYKAQFVEYNKIRPLPIHLADGSTTPAIAIGDVEVQLAGQSPANSTRIHGVYHVPGLTLNLLSTKQLKQRSIYFQDYPDGARLVYEGITIATAPLIGRHYILATVEASQMALAIDSSNRTTLTTPKPASKSSQTDNYSIWHARFGHISAPRLEKLFSVTRGLPSPITTPTTGGLTCGTCILAKQTKVINRIAPERATKPLERVYSDFAGPIDPGLNDEIYLLTFTDEYTRKVWAYPTRKRSDLYSLFGRWRTHVECQSGFKLRAIRADNAQEYKALASYIEPHGIAVEFTVPYLPEQNGIAERQNRTLFTLIRALLLDANLPTRFWPYAALAAAYIRNRAPTETINDRTPEGVWSNEEPSIGHMRKFGCLAYAHENRPSRSKLGQQAIRAVFVGYCNSSKQYRLFDLLEPRLFRATTVRFDESKRGWDATIKEMQGQRLEYARSALNQLDLAQYSWASDDEDSEAIPNLNKNIEPPRSIQDLPRFILPQESTSPTNIPTAIDEQHEQIGLLEPTSTRQLPSPPTQMNEPRRSGRNRRAPSRFEALYTAKSKTIQEPNSYKEAIKDPTYGKQWEQAIQEELASLESNCTWQLTDARELPAGQRTIGCKWVFKIKYSPNGLIERFKARLVARGFTQQYGVNYEQTFAPTLRFDTLRVLLALAAIDDLELQQMDVSNAYLAGDLSDEVLYMDPPEGLPADETCNQVCKLQKGLYGLKQAGRVWNKTLDAALQGLGFQATPSDPSVYRSQSNVIIGVYVDDLLLLGKDPQAIEHVKKSLARQFKIKDLGNANVCLGIQIHRDRVNRRLTIDQSAYTRKILAQFGYSEARAAASPADGGDRAITAFRDDSDKLADKALYMEAIGSLLWLARATRPDLAYILGRLCQHNSKPAQRHWEAVQRVFQYLAGTANYGICFEAASTSLTSSTNEIPTPIGYSDADFASNPNNRKSVSDCLFKLVDGAVIWGSRVQRSVSTSTTEAEYVALAEAGKIAKWLGELLADLGYIQLAQAPIRLYGDSRAALALTEDPKHHSRTKHIDVRHHLIRQLANDRVVELTYCSTNKMLADGLTKVLTGLKLSENIAGLGVKRIQ